MPSPTIDLVIGTAGHIDHGKTTLLKSLTGIDADRLKEERERGITIDIGFAPLLDPPYQFGFVDVPGHEKFIKNMLAGSGGIDCGLLVVAADEGVMPQTREHFEILQLLGIRQGVVALNKIDLVEPEFADLVAEDIRELVQGSFLESAPVVRTSASTGAGVAELKQVFRKMAARLGERKSDGIPRLFIDRVFQMRGFGAVVTGTTLSGVFQRNDRVEIFPGGREAKIRTIQVYEQESSLARAGQRTALNLSGLEPADLERGQAVTAPGVFTASQIFNARFRLLKSYPRPLKNLAPVHVYHGSAELLGRVHLLDRKLLEPGEETFIQVRLESPALIWPGDHFVVRQYSPLLTMGGGVILESHAERVRAKELEPVLGRLGKLHGAGEGERIRQLLLSARSDGVPVATLGDWAGRAEPRVRARLNELQERGEALPVTAEGHRWISVPLAEALRGKCLALLQGHLERNPFSPGIRRQELRSGMGEVAEETFGFILRGLQEDGRLKIQEEWVAPVGREDALRAKAEKQGVRLEARLRRAGAEGLSTAELKETLFGGDREDPSLLDFLLKNKAVVRVAEDYFVHPGVPAAAAAALRGQLKKGDPVEVGLLKDKLGLTRKRAIPLLEYLDRTGVTRRAGAQRFLA